MTVSSKIYVVFSALMFFMSGIFLLLGLMVTFLSTSYFIEWDISFFCLSVVMSLLFDWMSFFFLSCVCFISGSILKYSVYYMNSEKNYLRFVYSMVLFILSMWLLIVSPNMVSLLLGWDGLGLSSYILVIFYQSESSNSAGMITLMSNRIGDVSILMSIGLLSSAGNWTFIFLQEEGMMVVGLVTMAAMTKSAQIPFSAWLPAAMAAPTPVSSLVHSSTLVTAGVYLLIRFNSLLVMSDMSNYLLVISVMTSVMAGLSAMVENDMKKVVALSTLSQLGLMMVSLSVGMSDLAFFHLITHALFKSTLFMCVGFMIHSMDGSQDSRGMSGLSYSSPLISVLFSVTNMALAGFPFMAGFYSKDLILEGFMSGTNFLVLMSLLLATGLTVSYSLRVLMMSVSTISNLKSVSSVEDMSLVLVKSMGGLLLGSLVGGFFFFWVIYSSGYVFTMSYFEKFSVIFVSVLMGLISLMNTKLNSKSLKMSAISLVFMDMWFVHFISSKLITGGLMKVSGSTVNLMDKGWLEIFGGNGGQTLFLSLSGYLQFSQKSLMVGSYLVSFIMVAVLVLHIF